MKARLTNISTVIIGLTFTLSGFVKGVDPHGTAYKITDYLQAMGLSALAADTLTLAASCLLSAMEFMLGCCLLFRALPRLSTSAALAVMLVMTPLTLWLALYDPVSDCGCFGDALVLSNWQTFAKNVVLLGLCCYSCQAILATSPKRKRCLRNLTVPASSLALIALLQAWSLYFLPPIDFRPYHVGADIRQGMITPPNAPKAEYETRFIFARDGEEREFTLEDYPDSTWTLITSQVKMVRPGYVPPIHDFSIVRVGGHTDITDSILSLDRVILVLLKDLKTTDRKFATDLNALYDLCTRTGTGIYALTASTETEIDCWVAETHARYPFCLMDPTTIKTIIRSNPGIILLEQGVVKGKWSRHNIPQQL